MDIRDHYDEIARCNHCGFCQTSCPIFRATGHEAGVARGRIALLRALIEGRIEWTPELKEPLFACLGCGSCTANCFPGVDTTELILAARAEYLEKVGRNQVHRLLFNYLLPYPGRLRLAARAAALGKRTGISKIAKALGLLRFLGRDFPKAEGIVEQFPPQALRDKLKPGTLEGEGESLRIGYFVGCGVDIMTPDAAEATLRAMRAVAKSVTILENCCCGLPADTYGDREAARKLAARNLELLASDRFDIILTDCSSCASFLKKYPLRLFPEGDPLHAAATLAASRLRDFVELAAPPEPSDADPAEPLVVTYHDPCHASRGQGLVAEPRKLLQALPGIEYRELPEADWCCGGAGSYALSHYELSRQVLDRKMDNVAKTGASVLATSCPACIIQLSYGVRLHNLPVRVCHIAELLSPPSD